MYESRMKEGERVWLLGRALYSSVQACLLLAVVLMWNGKESHLIELKSIEGCLLFQSKLRQSERQRESSEDEAGSMYSLCAQYMQNTLHNPPSDFLLEKLTFEHRVWPEMRPARCTVGNYHRTRHRQVYWTTHTLSCSIHALLSLYYYMLSTAIYLQATGREGSIECRTIARREVAYHHCNHYYYLEESKVNKHSSSTSPISLTSRKGVSCRCY